MKPNMTFDYGFNLRVKDNHHLGLRIGMQMSEIKENIVLQKLAEGAAHEELKQMTKGNNHTYQLGLSYEYCWRFKNKFVISPSVDFGTLWLLKKPHFVEHYPDDQNLYTVKTLWYSSTKKK